jgi:hypothetical protein
MKKMMKSENIQNQSRIIIIIINSLIQNNYKKCKAKNQLRDKVAKWLKTINKFNQVIQKINQAEAKTNHLKTNKAKKIQKTKRKNKVNKRNKIISIGK